MSSFNFTILLNLILICIEADWDLELVPNVALNMKYVLDFVIFLPVKTPVFKAKKNVNTVDSKLLSYAYVRTVPCTCFTKKILSVKLGVLIPLNSKDFKTL